MFNFPCTAGKLVIINLQKTQHDNKAIKSGGLVIHARSDEVLAALMRRLGMPMPVYRRTDSVVVWHEQRAAAAVARRKNRSSAGAGGQRRVEGKAEKNQLGTSGHSNGDSRIPLTVYVSSTHGPKCPMPMVERVEFTFADPQLQPATVCQPPFRVRCMVSRPGQCQVRIRLHLHEAADTDKRTVDVNYTMDLQQQPAVASVGSRREQVTFLTQELDYGGSNPAPGNVDSVAEQQQQPGAEQSDGCSSPDAKRARRAE